MFGLFVFFGTPVLAFEMPDSLVLKTDFRIWEVNPQRIDLLSGYEKSFFNGLQINLSYDEGAVYDQYVTKRMEEGIDSMKVRRYLESRIAPDIYREKEDVAIDMSEDGVITFEGTGLYGRRLNIDAAVKMVEYALKNGVEYVNLPLIKENPTVTVLSDELRKKGIKELIGAGETDFGGSPYNRISNINVGLSKFHGHLVAPGEEFVFGETLGPVTGATGYLKELVIKGDKTIPEYGGGLCQVSTTAYRAALSAGLPITQRRNHSYAVSYYRPHGLDATVYPPTVDMRFVNDTPAHLVMQSFTIDNMAYYNFYGTRDERTVHLIGPLYHGWTSPPPKRTEYSDNLSAGEVIVAGHAVPGLSISWYRKVDYGKSAPENLKLVQSSTFSSTKHETGFLDHIYSKYQARPDYYIYSSADNSDGGDSLN
jgi:vancomycin resistance protein YoaR